MLSEMYSGMLLRISLVVFALCSGMPALADKPDAATRLQARLAPMSELSGRFEQSIYDDRGELLQRSAGNFALKRPNRLRWHTLEPYEHLVITDGQELLRWDPDLEQLNREPVSEEMMATPAMILGEGGDDLDQRYDIRARRQAGEDHFTLSPRQESPFTALTLRFDGERLSGIDMLDSLGQRTSIKLLDLNTRPALTAADFALPAEAID